MGEREDNLLQEESWSDATHTEVQTSDVELIARTVSGDERAFEELFDNHRRRVALIASRFFRKREQIEEIVQESFTKAYFALPEFSSDTESASFAGWLARIAFNVCYDELRRAKRRPENAAGEISAEETERINDQLRSQAAEDDIEAATISRDLASKLLSRLAPEDQLILVLLDAEGLSVKEIAELNEWSVSKVKVRAHRARQSLRRVLGKFL